MNDQPAIQCLCAWSDLLGFGTALRQGGWRDIETVKPALERMLALEQLVLDTANMSFDETTFMINDGVARNFDYVPHHGVLNLTKWLLGIFLTHHLLNENESHYKQPGVRTVVVAGPRIAYGSGDRTKGALLQRRDGFQGEDLSKIYHKQFLDRPILYMPLEFQMNLAFAKAYALEALGSRGGLGGPRLFFDISVINFLLTTLSGTEFQFMTPQSPVEQKTCLRSLGRKSEIQGHPLSNARSGRGIRRNRVPFIRS